MTQRASPRRMCLPTRPVDVNNTFFEVTPSRFFAGMITEYGVSKPFEARRLWESAWQALKRQAAVELGELERDRTRE